MNSIASAHHSLSENPSASQYSRPPLDSELRRLFNSAFSVLEQPPPPSLREILGAYRAKGDGDRDMLLSMLNAKSAEDQRIASVASLHRTVLEIYQANIADAGHHQPFGSMNQNHHYAASSFTHSPHISEQKATRKLHAHHRTSRSRSPSRSHVHITSVRDVPRPTSVEQTRKRPRTSQPSPHPNVYDPHAGSQNDHLPPSPYSSSGRSDSAEYSPRSRTSMAIGSLLSSGPIHPPSGDANERE
ncbi:hypothetical protein AMATHDRAFT_63583 [Amanita thiersii Skay4041]|uniref:Uncharacterized protein n=1 Tax=Amanita thiersii Skay4041 TaxID=703135 RepID=A0A2A9NLR9_9AGAR|nr:hypothetical protein AMATHDRAFT_63583 [Amanita thiersii Skay4041]